MQPFLYCFKNKITQMLFSPRTSFSIQRLLTFLTHRFLFILFIFSLHPLCYFLKTSQEIFLFEQSLKSVTMLFIKIFYFSFTFYMDILTSSMSLFRVNIKKIILRRRNKNFIYRKKNINKRIVKFDFSFPNLNVFLFGDLANTVLRK